MLRSTVDLGETKGEVNSYSRWAYDHPGRVLPEPTPELLRKKRMGAPQGSARLIVELGCGSGNFLLRLGQTHPMDHLVGFELRYKRLVKAARKFEKAGLERVWLLRESAERFPDYFAAGSVQQVHVNFPDPWPKVSQWKKRLLARPLLEALESRLAPGGTVHVKTDHSGYFLHILSLFRDRLGWKIQHFSNDLHRKGNPHLEFKTEFEQLFTGQNKAIFSLTAERTGGAR